MTAFVNNTTYFPPTADHHRNDDGPAGAPGAAFGSARDKVRAVVQSILVSPEYAIQR